MGSFSDYLELELLDHVFGNAAYSAPATVYARLYTADPSDTGGGTEVSTGVWTNYAPIAITNNATNFPAATAGSKKNGAIIDFGTATITGGPPVVTGIGIWDAASSGNLLVWSALSSSKTINNGDQVTIPINSLTINLD